MPPTTYRPAQDGRLAAQRPLCCWAAAAQIPIHRQIRRADLACLLKISEAIYAGCSNTKACPSCARKNRARLTRCLHPTCHRWSAAPAKTRRRVLAGERPSPFAPDAIPRLSFPNPFYFQPATLCILSAFPDCLFAEISSAGRLRRVASHRHRDTPECRHCSAFGGI